jgi:hypothetical protein
MSLHAIMSLTTVTELGNRAFSSEKATYRVLLRPMRDPQIRDRKDA